ncbi:toxin Cry1Ac domain D-VI-related protein, partial [Listeria grandensis]|uniref:toxin Cry1Ac domain D-VI-related protein n=1 Tax=Listeria grandensis TaxID=1494963 RepID=UPI001F4C54F1
MSGVVNLEWRGQLTTTLSTAQTLLDQTVEEANNLKAANEAVNKLFGDSGHTKLAEGITATDINQAKALANKVSNAGKKKELLDEIEKAQKLLDAKVVEANNLKAANEAVNKLFGDSGHTKLAEGITATDINQAKALANKVSNAGKKKELL